MSQIEISKRQAEIADLVQKTGFASVEDLAERFDVTTQTIRRDVNGLCELGMLRRTHGGVEPPAPASNIHYSTRQILNLREKQQIASVVADRIKNHQSLACSIGTTPEIVM
ncbi:MAG: DeoR family transcriptional regulator, partial [Pseudomonadota bacterium]